jgi:hypothetical protein
MKDEAEVERELLTGLLRLAAATEVPPPDAAREAALLAAFDARRPPAPRPSPRGAWWLAALASAAVLLIAAGIRPGLAGRSGAPPPDRSAAAHGAVDSRNVRPGPLPGDFIAWPGAAWLPPLESGELVRMDLPVAMLPSLGVAPPAAQVTAVKADVVIGQDGLARAVRFVGN